ncbi:MAG TPA: hypothetical protein DEB24_07015 [Coriobacteriia bacterium]|nr:hypothetical protein [Coriobacteriia bacterium]
MSKRIRNFLIIAAVLIVVGGVVSGIGFALGGMIPVSIGGGGIHVAGQGERNTVVDESFRNLSSVEINTDILELELRQGDAFRLEGTYDASAVTLDISESGGGLRIDSRSASSGFFGWNWGFGNFGFNTTVNKLVLTYPADTGFDSVSIKNDLGSLKIDGLSTKSLRAQLDAGYFKGSNISADTVDVDMNLGGCDITGLVVNNTTKFKMDAGSLNLIDSSLKDPDIKLNLGGFDYSGALNGSGRLTLDLGSLNLDLTNKEADLGYDIATDLGSINMNGRGLGSPVSTRSDTREATYLNIKCNLGSVDIDTK